MLKGTAEICLTNVKTGEKERYVEHNLFTKALEYMHQPIGAMKTAQNCTTDGYEPAYISLLGGLVLWDGNIEENREIITQPHGIKAVGCAVYGQTNTTTSSRRGSYNAAESVLTVTSAEKSMKFVYDFATNQANGTIKCVSLTNWKAGWNGFGGDEGGKDPQASRNNYSQHICYRNTCYYAFEANTTTRSYSTFFIDPDSDVFYQTTNLYTTSLTITKRKANLHEKSVFQDPYRTHDLAESISIQLPITLSGVNTWWSRYSVDENLLYIVVSPSASSIATSGTFYVIAVDLSDRTATVKTLTNSTGVSMSCYKQYMEYYDGYLYYISTGTRYVYKISVADGTYKRITVSNLWNVSGSTDSQSWYSWCGIFEMGGMLYFKGYKTISGTTYERMISLDPETNNTEQTGYPYAPNEWARYSAKMIPIKGHPLYYANCYYPSDTGTSSLLFLNTNYLATINNLSLPIEKTSDKTMKITYTIQEV